MTVVVSLQPYSYFRYGDYYDSHVNKTKDSPPTIIRTADMVQGKAKVDLNVKELEPYLQSKTSTNRLQIVATVEEEFTGYQINGTTYATLFPYRYTMHCISYSTCSTFHANREFDVEFLVTYIDGSILNDTTSVLELTYTEKLNKYHTWYPISQNDDGKEKHANKSEPVLQNLELKFTGKMNETGIVRFKVKLPPLQEYQGYGHFYTMDLKYRDETHSIYNAYMYREPEIIDNPIDNTYPKHEEPEAYLKLIPGYLKGT